MNFTCLFVFSARVDRQHHTQVKSLSTSMYRPLLNSFLSVMRNDHPAVCILHSRPPPTQKKKKLSTLSGQTVACHRSQLKETKDQKAHINSHINSSPSQTGFKSCASLTIAWPECIWGKVVFLYLEGSCTQVTFVWQSESSQNFHRSAAIQKKIK